MSRIFHVWWLVIVAVIAIALILVWAYYSASQSLSANSLNGAVEASANYARDNSSRLSRGTFVINRDAFQKRLSEYKIKAYGKVGSKRERPSKLYVHYLLDNTKSDKNNKQNWSVVSNNYKHNHPNETYRTVNGKTEVLDPQIVNGYISADNYDGSNQKGQLKQDKYLAIRGIQVSAIADAHNHKWNYTTRNGHQVRTISSHYSKPNDITNTNNKYVATLIVQGADQDFSNKSENDKYMNMEAMHHPNRNSDNYDDPTMNSFNGTNSSHSNGVNDGYQTLNTRNNDNIDD